MRWIGASLWTGWTPSAVADKRSQKLEIIVAVRQQNLDQLERELMAVSDPRSSRYGKHLSKQEVDALVAPAAESVAAVTAWLKSHGIHANRKTANGDFLRATATVEQAEAALSTSYALFTHAATNTVVCRASAVRHSPVL
jgi:tripeptidyl-peptidase-1